MLAVAAGDVDAAAVDSLVYQQMTGEDPSIAERIKVVQRSPPFGMPPVVVPAPLAPELKNGIRRVLLQMHQDPEGQSVLDSLGIECFVQADDQIYDSVREAAQALERNR